MHSIRNLLLCGFVGLAVVGCQEKHANTPVTLNNTALTVDGATQRRDDEPSNVPIKAVYANGDVQANHDRFHLQASDGTVDTWGWATETPLFVANSVVWPFTYFFQPPGQYAIHQSVSTPPTNHAIPKVETIPSYGLAPDGRRGDSSGASASK